MKTQPFLSFDSQGKALDVATFVNMVNKAKVLLGHLDEKVQQERGMDIVKDNDYYNIRYRENDF